MAAMTGATDVPALRIEVIGVGKLIVQAPEGGHIEHILYVVQVSQQGTCWMVYRRVITFTALFQHLATAIPNIAPCPVQPTLTFEEARDIQGVLQDWMQQLVVLPSVPQTPVMRNFLCAEANLPPPGIEIEWSRADPNASFDDEMEMDELFDRHLDEKEAHFEDDGFGGGGRGGSQGRSGAALGESSHHGGKSGRSPLPFGEGSAAGSFQSFEPGVAHSFTQANGLDNYFTDDDDDSDFEDRDEAEPIAAVALAPVGASGHHEEATNGLAIGQAADSEAGQRHMIPGREGIGAATAGAMTSSAAVAAAAAAPSALDSFKIVRVIGKGSFGKVFLVREKETGVIYAMKVLRKENIIKRNQIEHTRTERNVLGYVRHRFIVGLKMAFQTRDKLFFVLDYCAGGELFFHLGKLGKFPEVRARFYAAEITLALGYVHELDIIYRDLKPENVLLDEMGHVRLTDFGLSKEGISNNTSGANSFCGTPEYLAPEILNRQGHGRAVDWWSLGALLYEMLTGLPPFYCRDREKLFQKIRSGALTFPRYLSEDSKGILNGLLTRDPSLRLGSGPTDAEEVKTHDFYQNIEWDHLAEGRLAPPWEPVVTGSLDTSQFDAEFTSMPIMSPNTKESLIGSSHDNAFSGFSFTESSLGLGERR